MSDEKAQKQYAQAMGWTLAENMSGNKALYFDENG
jgi:hypothetical protein